MRGASPGGRRLHALSLLAAAASVRIPTKALIGVRIAGSTMRRPVFSWWHAMPWGSALARAPLAAAFPSAQHGGKRAQMAFSRVSGGPWGWYGGFGVGVNGRWVSAVTDGQAAEMGASRSGARGRPKQAGTWRSGCPGNALLSFPGWSHQGSEGKPRNRFRGGAQRTYNRRAQWRASGMPVAARSHPSNHLHHGRVASPPHHAHHGDCGLAATVPRTLSDSTFPTPRTQAHCVLCNQPL